MHHAQRAASQGDVGGQIGERRLGDVVCEKALTKIELVISKRADVVTEQVVRRGHGIYFVKHYPKFGGGHQCVAGSDGDDRPLRPRAQRSHDRHRAANPSAGAVFCTFARRGAGENVAFVVAGVKDHKSLCRRLRRERHKILRWCGFGRARVGPGGCIVLGATSGADEATSSEQSRAEAGNDDTMAKTTASGTIWVRHLRGKRLVASLRHLGHENSAATSRNASGVEHGRGALATENRSEVNEFVPDLCSPEPQ